jgi:heterodisulfide reductase subunit A-like polyferredoxin
LAEKACQHRQASTEQHLEQLKGSKILFAGCPYLEESGFYARTIESLGLRRGDYLLADLKSGVFDLYGQDTNVEENLISKLSCLAKILAAGEPVEDSPVEPDRKMLVVGSGLSGLTAALELARDGFSVDLLETKDRPVAPGCLAWQLQHPRACQQLREQAARSEHIALCPSGSLSWMEPAEAGFLAGMASDQRCQYGAVVFAPERTEAESDEIGAWNLSQLFDRLGAGQPVKGRIVFLLDRHGPMPAELMQDVLTAALTLKERHNAEAWILLTHVRVAIPGLQELYDLCRDKGVVFIKYENLHLVNEYGDFEIRGRDTHSGQDFRISKPDRLVIPGRTGLSDQTMGLAKKLGLRMTDGSYSQPDSLWRLPNESNRQGILVAGSARANMDASGVLADAVSLAHAVSKRLSSPGLSVLEHVAVVDADRCAYCLTCLRVCPFGAVTKDAQERVARVIKTACQGCGICAGECPAEAIQLRNLSAVSIGEGLQVLTQTGAGV